MAARTKKAPAGFWDTYQDEGGGKFLSAAEKNAIIENGVVLQIVGVRFDEKNQYQGNEAPRYVVTFLVPNALTGENEERFAGFALNPEGSSRDRLLGALMDYLETKEGAADTILVTLSKVGNFVLIEKAEA